MGTFAETAIIDYHFPFADQGKQTSVFSFHLQNKRKFAPSVFCLQQTNGVAVFRQFCFPLVEFETWRHGHGGMETWRYRHGNMET
jgi:hypothetical protein